MGLLFKKYKMDTSTKKNSKDVHEYWRYFFCKKENKNGKLNSIKS